MERVQTIFHGCCRVGECHQQIQLGKNHLKIKDISCLSRTPTLTLCSTERFTPFLHYMRALRHWLCCATFPSRATSLPFARIRTRSEKSNANHMSWYRISASFSAYEFTNGCGASPQHLHAHVESIMSDPNHKLRKLLPPPYKSNYYLRHARTFTLPRYKTDRFKNSFFMASGRIVNNF